VKTPVFDVRKGKKKRKTSNFEVFRVCVTVQIPKSEMKISKSEISISIYEMYAALTLLFISNNKKNQFLPVCVRTHVDNLNFKTQKIENTKITFRKTLYYIYRYIHI